MTLHILRQSELEDSDLREEILTDEMGETPSHDQWYEAVFDTALDYWDWTPRYGYR